MAVDRCAHDTKSINDCGWAAVMPAENGHIMSRAMDSADLQLAGQGSRSVICTS